MIPYQSKEDVKTQGTDVGHWRCHCGLATLGEPVPGPEVGEVSVRQKWGYPATKDMLQLSKMVFFYVTQLKRE